MINQLFKSKTYLKLTTIFVFIASLLFFSILFIPYHKLTESLLYSSVIIIGFVVAFLMTTRKSNK